MAHHNPDAGDLWGVPLALTVRVLVSIEQYSRTRQDLVQRFSTPQLPAQNPVESLKIPSFRAMELEEIFQWLLENYPYEPGEITKLTGYFEAAKEKGGSLAVADFNGMRPQSRRGPLPAPERRQGPRLQRRGSSAPAASSRPTSSSGTTSIRSIVGKSTCLPPERDAGQLCVRGRVALPGQPPREDHHRARGHRRHPRDHRPRRRESSTSGVRRRRIETQLAEPDEENLVDISRRGHGAHQPAESEPCRRRNSSSGRSSPPSAAARATCTSRSSTASPASGPASTGT